MDVIFTPRVAVARARRRAAAKAATLVVALSAALSTAAVVAPTSAGASTRSTAIAEARTGLIVKSDFPAGWTSSPSSNSSSTLGDAQVAACLGVSVAFVKYNPPSAYSPDFSDAATGTSVSDDVSVFPSEKIARAQFSVFTSARTPVCFAKVFNIPSFKKTFEGQLGSGVKIGTVTAAWLAKPPVGDGASALQVTLPFTEKGAHYSIAITLVTMISKLVGAQLSFTTIDGASFPASLATHLEKVTVQRLP